MRSVWVPATLARILHVGICGLGVTIAASACGWGGTTAGTGADHVTVAVLPFLSVVPFHIAAEEGYFADQNLDVEFVKLGRDLEIMTSLARGHVDVASGMVTLNELNLAAMGVRVRLVATMSTLDPGACTYAAVLTRREHLESGALLDPVQVRQLKFDVNVATPHGYWVDQLLRPHRPGGVPRLSGVERGERTARPRSRRRRAVRSQLHRSRQRGARRVQCGEEWRVSPARSG